MNTIVKSVSYRMCKVCSETFGVSGTVPFQLAEYRKPDTDPSTGEFLLGTCPKHKRRDGE